MKAESYYSISLIKLSNKSDKPKGGEYSVTNTEKANRPLLNLISRLSANPPNDLPDEAYRKKIDMMWDDQWLNWDDLGGDDPGWGDIGD